MLRNKRMMSAMYITLILIIFLGCEKSDGERHEKFPKYTSLKYTPLKYTSKYTSFRDIPGITEDEIKAIEALRKQYVSFVYGITPSTEAFNKNSGGIGGFSALFCEWLTRLFEIPFKPTVYEWGDLLQKLHAGEVDFSGDISPTDERRNIYFMTETIALRTLKYIRIKGSTQLSEIAKVRPLQLVFFEGATTYNHVVSSDAYDTFKAHFVKNKEAAYDLLKSRKADALIAESVVEADFDVYGDVVTSDFFPLVYSSVSLATQNPALKPIISIVQKALENEGLHYLSELYSKGYREYMKHKLFMRLSDEEIAYINTHSLIPFAVEYDNYPVSFYNTRYKEWQGISIDVLREVEALTGLNFVVAHDQNTKWPELLKMLEDGKVFMISELIRSKDREGRFLWPKSSLL
ncbi:MAG: transporter substrate-binding domain-containing protein, partial [Leptospirales bacterium]|nr:transporter substrate-binding domain-containing protein [Leptospirales bacterium]